MLVLERGRVVGIASACRTAWVVELTTGGLSCLDSF